MDQSRRPKWLQHVDEWLQARGKALARESGEEEGHTSKRPCRRILFIGDSLMAGVGCNTGEWGLPQRVAQHLALKLDSDVDWRSFSVVGGDVKTLQVKIRTRDLKHRLAKFACQIRGITAEELKRTFSLLRRSCAGAAYSQSGGFSTEAGGGGGEGRGARRGCDRGSLRTE